MVNSTNGLHLQSKYSGHLEELDGGGQEADKSGKQYHTPGSAQLLRSPQVDDLAPKTVLLLPLVLLLVPVASTPRRCRPRRPCLCLCTHTARSPHSCCNHAAQFM